jgi:hypothetical protein
MQVMQILRKQGARPNWKPSSSLKSSCMLQKNNNIIYSTLTPTQRKIQCMIISSLTKRRRGADPPQRLLTFVKDKLCLLFACRPQEVHGLPPTIQLILGTCNNSLELQSKSSSIKTSLSENWKTN